jgi:hypothetical protein
MFRTLDSDYFQLCYPLQLNSAFVSPALITSPRNRGEAEERLRGGKGWKTGRDIRGETEGKS